MNYRTEADSLWKKQIPIDALYGIQTLRAAENFPISGQALLPEVIQAYALLKKSAAIVNRDLGKLDPVKSKLITKVCREIIDRKHDKQFIVDVFQAGAGTSTNMNLNEVIANRALELMWKSKWSYDIVSPNDHVNMSQSTNDTYPTMMRMALALQSKTFLKNFDTLIDTFDKKAKEFKNIITAGRTHLQDATPISVGQEFAGYSATLQALRDQYLEALEKVKVLWIGWSAVGTWINTHKDYHKKMVVEIETQTGIHFHSCDNLVESMQSQRQIGSYMSALKSIAIEVSKICDDLRLLSSGPHTGIWELILPAVQPGSSIMPGKVNPSILECANMICFKVIGSEAAVTQCLLAWQINLNVFMPLMSYESISSTNILSNMFAMMAEKCISGIKVDEKKCHDYAYESNAIFTILNPILWYNKVAELIKQKEKTWFSIKKLLIDKHKMSKKEVEELLKVENLINP